MIALLGTAVALLSVLLGAVCWTLYGLLRQNGRLLARVEALEGSSAPLSLARSRINRAGLAPGTIAPDFRLPTLDGGEATLADYAGNWLVLVFSDPDCAPCTALLPRLEHAARRSHVPVLLISRGDADANREKLRAAGVTLRTALQRQWEISRLYARFATPIGYLIDPQGRITDSVAAGADAILALFSNREYLRTQSAPERHSARAVVH